MTNPCSLYPHKPHPYTDLYEFGKRHTEVHKWCPGSTEDWTPEADFPVDTNPSTR